MSKSGPDSAPYPYSLMQVDRIQQLAIRKMDPGEMMLYKLGADEHATQQLIEKFLKPLEEYQSLITIDIEDILKELASSFGESANINHLLGNLVKNSFFHSPLINKYDLRIRLSWEILCRQLMEIKDHKAKAHLTQRVFLEFIGQMVRIDNRLAARIIHNFFHLAKKITLTPASGMSTESVGKVLGPCLWNGLSFQGCFIPAANTDETESLKQEMILWSSIAECLLEHIVFTREFNAEYYKPFFQRSFESEFPSLTDSLTKRMQALTLTHEERRLKRSGSTEDLKKLLNGERDRITVPPNSTLIFSTSPTKEGVTVLVAIPPEGTKQRSTPSISAPKNRK